MKGSGILSGGVEMGRKSEKAEQRKKYHETFRRVKHSHGSGLSVKKKEEAALGK